MSDVVMTPAGSAGTMGFTVARLATWLDARGTGIHMAAPACHAAFLTHNPMDAALMLRVRNGAPTKAPAWRPVYSPSETWELWLDEVGRYVFLAAPQSSPKRHLIVDRGFASGEVLGEFGAYQGAGQGIYPLQDIDIVLYANRLADCGDVILHAAGVAVDGRGYCFAGASGAGKSTMATSLSANPSVTVLGEDQVIVRRLDGRFWIFGTPWHTNPALCSPQGVPLDKLFFLDRSGGYGIKPLRPVDGVVRLLQTAFIPYYRPAAVAKILDRLPHLAEQVPFSILGFQLGTDALQLIRAA